MIKNIETDAGSPNRIIFFRNLLFFKSCPFGLPMNLMLLITLLRHSRLKLQIKQTAQLTYKTTLCPTL